MNTTLVIVDRVDIYSLEVDYDKEKQLIDDLVAHREIDTVKGLANVEAMNGYAVADKLTPRQFAELTDVDIEQVRVLYSAYAVSTENYGRVVGGIDEYGVPLDFRDDFFVAVEVDFVGLSRLGVFSSGLCSSFIPCVLLLFDFGF